MFKRGRLLVIVSSLVLLLVSAPTSSYAIESQEPPTNDLETLQESINKTKVIENPKEERKMIQQALRELKKHPDLITISINKLDIENAKLVEAEADTGKILHSVVFPTKLENAHELTNVSVVFGKNNPNNQKFKKLIATTEWYLTENEEGNFTVAMYQDGKEGFYEETEIEFQTTTEFQEAQEGTVTTMGFDLNELASCLGISAALAGVIVSGCAVACFFTAGIGCITCLSLAFGFNLGGSTACIQAAFE